MNDMVGNFPAVRTNRDEKKNVKAWSTIFNRNCREITVPFAFQPKLLGFLVKWQALLGSISSRLVSPVWHPPPKCGTRAHKSAGK